MTCRRCGDSTPRLTLTQRHCPQCERETQAIMAADARRREPRFQAKDLSPWTGERAA